METLYFKSLAVDGFYKAIYVIQGEVFPFTITESFDGNEWLYEKEEFFVTSAKRLSLEELTSDSLYWDHP